MQISINLLPLEITAEESKRAKFYKIQTIGVVIILTLTFLTSLTLALRILQSRDITLHKAKVAQAEQRVSDLKDIQAALVLLKDRLTVINQYWGVSSKQNSMYQLIDRLLPSSVTVTGVSVDRTGGATLTVAVPDSASLDNLVNNLTTKESNEGKISQIAIESLIRGKDGFYRMSFSVKSKL